jgi:hypothetical protein
VSQKSLIRLLLHKKPNLFKGFLSG